MHAYVNASHTRTYIHQHAQVCDNRDYFVEHIQNTLDSLGANFRATELLTIHDSYKGSGYAVSTESELKTIVEVAQSTGILCDPVYTGKALCGMVHCMRQRPEVFQGRRVLFVHTGGLYGMYDKV
jgi:D-cysteine desulfhydrase